VVTRLRFGTCLTNEFLKKINAVTSDKSQDCDEHVETVEHIVLGCAKSNLCSKVLNACSVLNVSRQLELVLKNSAIIDIIYRNMKRRI